MASTTIARSPLSIFSFFLVAAAFAAGVASAAPESPFIVAHKKATLERIDAATERVLVSIDVYNQGSVSAYEVGVNDDTWSRDIFGIVRGNLSKTWERLEAGAIVSHSFELETTVKGMANGAPALVTFRIPTNSELQVAYSNPILPLDILAEKVKDGKLDLAKRLLAAYGSHISVISLVTLFAYLISTPSKSSAAKTGKKRH